MTIREAKWHDVADACEALGREHWDEASGGVAGEYKLNRELMGVLEGASMLRVFVAESDAGDVVGYCIWTRDVSLETSTGNGWEMGPYFVHPAKSGACIGIKLLRHSIDAFRRDGADRVRLHHTMYGRGARLGVLYQRLGATEYQREYRLEL